MKETVLYIYFGILVLSFIVSLIYYKKIKKEPLYLLSFFLGFTVFSQTFSYILWHVFRQYNIWWSNIYMNIEVLFYLYIFYQYIENKIVKKVLLWGGISFEIYYLVSFLILSENYNISQSFPYSFGSLFIIFAIFWLLIEMFKSDKVLYMAKYLIYWVSIGALIYYVVNFPINISDFFLSREEFIDDTTYRFRNIILNTSNILYYGIITIGIIWSSKPYHS